MGKRHNPKGRSTTERFISLPHWMLNHRAWLSLSPVERCTLLEVMRLYNGANNGRLGLSNRVAAERIGCSKDTAGRALRTLVERGFIEVAERGRFDRKSPHATEFRLTLYGCDRTGQLASKAFARWVPGEPPKSVAGPTGGTAGPTHRDSAEPHATK